MAENALPVAPVERTSFQEEISNNKLKSYALCGVVFAVLLVLLYVFAEIYTGETSVVFFIFAFLIAIAYTAGTYFYGDRIVLASVNAQPVTDSTPKGAYLKNVVENLAFAARLPKTPDLYVIESDESNAFATGRDPQHASIAVTTGLLNKLNRTELEGVVAHEMSHIQNYDIRFALLVAVMVGLIAIMSELFLRSFRYGGGGDRKGKAALLIIIGLILAILAPIFVRLVQSAVSRKREFMADASGAKLTRYPLGLASALEKIKGNKGTMKVSEAESHLFFADPVSSHLDSLFATHPPIDERIRVLRAM